MWIDKLSEVLVKGQISFTAVSTGYQYYVEVRLPFIQLFSLEDGQVVILVGIFPQSVEFCRKALVMFAGFAWFLHMKNINLDQMCLFSLFHWQAGFSQFGCNWGLL